MARILRQGGRVAYVAEAQARHSHNYTLSQEFRRYYDTAKARKVYGNELECGETEGKRGRAFTKSLFKEVLKKQPRLLSYAFCNTLAKWLGYRVGSRFKS